MHTLFHILLLDPISPSEPELTKEDLISIRDHEKEIGKRYSLDLGNG